MVMFINGAKMSVSPSEFQRLANQMLEVYPSWSETENFAQEVRSIVLEDTPISERTTLDSTMRVIEEIGERYGHWQNKECIDLKNELMRIEEPATGRVRLEKFYAPALTNRSWQFTESVPYLRSLGALDESDTLRLSVIIPNYINAPTNCVASSRYFSVCCMDECEAILGALEIGLAAPGASPSRIAELVGTLPLAVLRWPRGLSTSLLRRLEDIAAHHEGHVPLHGRLFAQWLHHGFPLECPYPHVSGTTDPLTQAAWMERKKEPLLVTDEEIVGLLEGTNLIPPFPTEGATTDQETALPWSVEEELFVFCPAVREADHQVAAETRNIPFLIVVAFALTAILRKLSTNRPDALPLYHVQSGKRVM
jgi:hypothetical protein